MFEKVNPSHPDKVADRIAGAIVDLVYSKQERPRIAVEVLIGHGHCHIITESSVNFNENETEEIVERIAGANIAVDLKQYPQDSHLAENQASEMRAGDNGIFKGVPTSDEEYRLTITMRQIYDAHPSDGKAISAFDMYETYCLSKVRENEYIQGAPPELRNPLGYWEGGLDVDTGATNRKLGSDMGRAVTGGGLHGKDFSKADVSVNIWCHVMANRCKRNIEACCSIGSSLVQYRIEGIDEILTVGFSECVREAKAYIESLGGFESLAEWGLIR